MIDDLGIIQSGFRLAIPDGAAGAGCYTDLWSRRTGKWLCISAHFALFDVPMRADALIAPEAANPGRQDDRAALHMLNADFLRSVRESDAGWFDSKLDADFLNSNPDGSLAERAAFLANIARPSAVPDVSVQDVRIGIFGEVALIRARTRFTKPGGHAGIGRYTELRMRRQGRWQCPAAHVTRG